MLDILTAMQWIQEHLSRNSKPELRAVSHLEDEPVLRFTSVYGEIGDVTLSDYAEAWRQIEGKREKTA